MNILEKEIEQIVWDAINQSKFELLRKKGLYLSSDFKYLRQYDLCEYGRLDMVGIKVTKGRHGEKTITVNIIELKKDRVDFGTLIQAIRYAKGFEQKLGHQGIKYNVEFRFTLIGRCVDLSSDFCYFADIFQNISIYTYSIHLEKGIVFTGIQDYFLTDNGFNENQDDLRHLVKDCYKNHIHKSSVPDDLPF